MYHGTVDTHVQAILARGIQVSQGRPNHDFGPGFYVTTLQRQAEAWAWQLGQRVRGARPAILRMEIDRDALAELDVLMFVRGSFDADDYWSFVSHCRAGAPSHERTDGPSTFYDVVAGPVAAFWEQRVAMQDADQISFHTPAAEALLNNSLFLSRTWTV